MSLSVPAHPAIRTGSAPARPARILAWLTRPRTPWQYAGIVLAGLAHLVVVGSLVVVTPLLVRSVRDHGQQTCDLSHVTARQALTGTVCGRRMLNATLVGRGSRTGHRATAARP